MSFTNYKYGTGLSNVGSYQVSGKPFLSGGIDTSVTDSITFPTVTRWVHISSSAPVKIGMSALGVDGENYFTVDTASGQSLPTLEIKCTELHFAGSATVDVVAGLTGIDIERITNISPSGSNWSGSLGIG
jgi:hypothetical protein